MERKEGQGETHLACQRISHAHLIAGVQASRDERAVAPEHMPAG